MKKYECYKAEQSETKTGKALKKLVLQGDGDQYPIKNVTMWANHPLFEDMSAGWVGELEIKEEDSGNPNPHAPGKNYINRTVIDPNFTPKSATPKTTTVTTPTPARTTNQIDFQVMPALKRIEQKVDALNDRLDVFIDKDGIQPNFDKKTPEEVDDSNPF